MMHKAWCSIEEVPYCFPRPSIKFQGHKGQKIDDLDQIWARLLGRSQLSNPSDLPFFYNEMRCIRNFFWKGKTVWWPSLYDGNTHACRHLNDYLFFFVILQNHRSFKKLNVGSSAPGKTLLKWGPGGLIQYKDASIGNPIVVIRWSYDNLISTMGFPNTGKMASLYWIRALMFVLSLQSRASVSMTRPQQNSPKSSSQ